MKKIIVSILLCLSVFGANAQSDEIFEFCEVMPTFVGGEDSIQFFFTQNIVPPPLAKQNKKQGKITVQFTVEPNSSLSYVKFAKTFDDDWGAEAVRVVKLMKWTPGMQRDKKVRVKKSLTIGVINNEKIAVYYLKSVTKPSFSKDEFELERYLYENLKYPKQAKENKTEGYVTVNVTIDSKGDVTTPVLVNDIGDGCGEEAIRIVKNMPKWAPETWNGESVSGTVDIKVKFKIDPKDNIIGKVYANARFDSFPAVNGINIHKFLIDSVVYTEEIRALKSLQHILVSFIVEEDGSISNIEFDKPTSPIIKPAALETIQKLNPCSPAYLQGKPVRYLYRGSISFNTKKR